MLFNVIYLTELFITQGNKHAGHWGVVMIFALCLCLGHGGDEGAALKLSNSSFMMVWESYITIWLRSAQINNHITHHRM